MSFSAIQQRVNSAVAAKLMTDIATLNDVKISGKFVSPGATVLSMMDGNDPSFSCLSSQLSGDPRGKLLELNSIGYAVRRAIPDGSGITVLALEQLNDVMYAAAVLKLRPLLI
ncbi:MAG: hypothetical protein WC710_11425 [Gallionella sp.]|jgi:hypothetical protein